MPIAVGQSQTFQLDVGETLAVSSNSGFWDYVVTFAADPPQSAVYTTPSTRITIGPFLALATVTVRNQTVDWLTAIPSEFASLVTPVVPRVIGSTYTLQSTDDQAVLIATGTTTITVPAGLTLTSGAIVRCPTSATVTVQPGTGAVLLNGASSPLARTRATCPNGFAITPNTEINSWGVSNGVVQAPATTFASLTGAPTDNSALAAALAAKADASAIVGLPVTLLRTIGPRNGQANGTFQIFNVQGSNPSQVVLTAGQLATVQQRIIVRFFATKGGTTDPLIVNMYMGTNGTTADQQINGTGTLGATTREVDAEWVIQRLDATHVACMSRTNSSSTTAFPGASFTVPNMDTNGLAISLAIKTGATDVPTFVSIEVELK